MSRIYEAGCICPDTPCPYHANGQAPIKLTRIEEVQRNAVNNHDGTHTLNNRDYSFLLNEAILRVERIPAETSYCPACHDIHAPNKHTRKTNGLR